MLRTATNKYETDMTKGNLLPKMIAFALPVVLTSILGLLYNTADMVVVGQFLGSDAIGAVGATTSVNSMLTFFASGLSGGAGIALTYAFGAKNNALGNVILHTSMLLGVIIGLVIGLVGFFCSEPLLVLMKTPDIQLKDAVDYLKIICLGYPLNMISNFGGSMLRGTGDVKRPLIYNTISGVLNVICNVIFVAVFASGVKGVAFATILSQGVSAFCVVVTLLKNTGFIRLKLGKLKIDPTALKMILKYGVPSGIQLSLFSLCSVILQSTINGFGKEVVNSSAISQQIELYIYALMSAIITTTGTGVGQNFGAKDFARIKKCYRLSNIMMVIVGATAGLIVIIFNKQICKIFINGTDSPEQADIIFGLVKERLLIVAATYFIDGLFESGAAALRGIGYSFTSMLIVLVGTCFFRIAWIYLIFPLYSTLWFLYMLYPASYVVTLIAICITFKLKLGKEENIYKQSLIGEAISK